jgi:hypothetical protein
MVVTGEAPLNADASQFPRSDFVARSPPLVSVRPAGKTFDLSLISTGLGSQALVRRAGFEGRVPYQPERPDKRGLRRLRQEGINFALVSAWRP